MIGGSAKLGDASIGTRFVPNVDRLWGAWPLLRRFEFAAAHGFRQVEFLYPQEHDPELVDRALRRTGLQVALFNAGMRLRHTRREGLLSVPGSGDEFADGMARDLELARRWSVRRVHAVAGTPAPGDAQRAVRTAVENRSRVADAYHAAGVTILVEFINQVDQPGYGIASFDAAVEIVTRVGHPAVALQFDYYHLVMAGLDPAQEVRRHLDLVGHVQVAQAPGRVEPERGAQPVSGFVAVLDDLGYDGLVGLEYDPRPGGEATFDWLDPWRANRT